MPDPDYTALAAQFGGTPATPGPPQTPPAGSDGVDYAALAAQYGGAPATTDDDTDFHPLNSISNAVGEFWNKVNPITAAQGINAAVHDPLSAAKAAGTQTGDIYNKMKDSWDKGDHIAAIRHGINYALSGIPGLGASIEDAQDKQAAGNYSGATGASLGIGANLALPAKVPQIMGAVGRGLKLAAEPVAESALGIQRMQRAYGKTPGAAVLEETTGFKPATVANSAKNKLTQLNSELENKVATSNIPTSLAPARKVIADRARVAASGNSSYTPDELAQMQAQLTVPRRGFAGATSYPPGAATPIKITPAGAVVPGPSPPLTISEIQDPATMLRMKREFGNDFTKWNPLHPQKEMVTARQAYGAMDNQLDQTPGVDKLNQRISSLIPVKERGELEDLGAGVTQRAAHRVAAHTGALVAGAEGYHLGGLPGAVAGIVGPELLASPTGQMAVARGLYRTGKAASIPAVGKTATGVAAAGAVLRNPYREPPEGVVAQ